MRRQHRMAVSVYESRQHHLPVKIAYLGTVAAILFGIGSIACENDFLPFYCNSFDPFPILVHSIYISIYIKLVSTHRFSSFIL